MNHLHWDTHNTIFYIRDSVLVVLFTGTKENEEESQERKEAIESRSHRGEMTGPDCIEEDIFLVKYKQASEPNPDITKFILFLHFTLFPLVFVFKTSAD